jgi:hypothetical protein
MAGRMPVAIAVGLFLGLAPPPALPCSLCNGPQRATLRQDAAQAQLVLYGRLANARLQGDDPAGGGSTDLHVEWVIKGSLPVGAGQILQLPRYVPLDPQKPARFLVFCDVVNGRLDPYRGVPAPSTGVVDYLRGALAIDPRNRGQLLLYHFAYLDHEDPLLAGDAFLEWVKATDQEIGEIAGRLPAARLRNWVADAKTPADRLNLYAFLLGACGGDRDADLLRSLLEQPGGRGSAAGSGLLSGYICLRPRAGWDLALTILHDARRPFTERYAVLGTLRFYHGWKPAENRQEIVRCLAAAVAEGDLADLAVEDARRWQLWELTEAVLTPYARATHDAPIVRRAIVRFALCSQEPAAARFLAERRRREPDLVAEVEEALRLDRQP